MPKIIWIELISHYYNDSLIEHFDINITKELINQIYFGPSFRNNVKAYIKDCNVCLALKAIKHKPYNNVQALFLPTNWWKDFLMDFVTRLLISTNWKCKSYNSILVIVDWLIKIVHYKLVKITINALWLAKVILNIVV